MLTALPIPDDSQREQGANKFLICNLIWCLAAVTQGRENAFQDTEKNEHS